MDTAEERKLGGRLKMEKEVGWEFEDDVLKRGRKGGK